MIAKLNILRLKCLLSLLLKKFQLFESNKYSITEQYFTYNKNFKHVYLQPSKNVNLTH